MRNMNPLPAEIALNMPLIREGHPEIPQPIPIPRGPAAANIKI